MIKGAVVVRFLSGCLQYITGDMYKQVTLTHTVFYESDKEDHWKELAKTIGTEGIFIEDTYIAPSRITKITNTFLT